MFFCVFFATLFGKRVKQGDLELIVSEPYHDERVPAVQTFTPWLAGAALLLVIAYAAPIAQTIRSNFPGAPGYSPDNPRPITSTRVRDFVEMRFLLPVFYVAFATSAFAGTVKDVSPQRGHSVAPINWIDDSGTGPRTIGIRRFSRDPSADLYPLPNRMYRER